MDGVTKMLIQQGHYDVSQAEVLKMLMESDRQLNTARYYVHKLRVTQYAKDVLNGDLTQDQASENYTEAMRNYDQIIESASDGRACEPMAEEVAKGAQAIALMVEEVRKRNG